jgi:ribosomal protein L11 methyltransferase
MAWQELSFRLRREAQPEAERLLQDAGALSVSYRDAADEPLLEPAPGETPLWEALEVSALFDETQPLAPVLDALSTHFEGIAPRQRALQEEDWSKTWSRDLHAMRFGRNLWVCPSSDRVRPPEGVVVELDPGLAFGTGTHPTTALCLEWLDRHPPTGQTVIDFGCGSGILALAACALGAHTVQAVDIDPQALTATRENARRNAIPAEQLVLATAERPLVQADLLLANILANPLTELAGRLAAAVRPGGTLVLAGLLSDQAGGLIQAYAPWCSLRSTALREGWVLLELTRDAA